MSDAPERIWIEDEFGDGDDDQWTYGTWDVRNYRGYVVEYVRADIVQALTAERDRLSEALADAAGALDAAGMELSDFANCLSREPWSACLAYKSAIDARAALKGETP